MTRTISDLKFVVVGSGASGTGFTHKLLNNCGIKTGHEAVFSPYREFDDRSMDNDLVGESSYMAVPWLEQGGFGKTVVVHVVRDTLSVIRSLVGREFPVGAQPFYDAWLYHHLPAIRPVLPNKFSAVLFYYLRWNERCEALANYRVRVEDLTSTASIKELLSVLRVEASDEQIAEALVATPTNYNSRPRGEISIEAVLLDPLGAAVACMAERYGYDL